MPLNKLIEPVGCVVDVTNGGMSGATGQYSKKFADLRELYADKLRGQEVRLHLSARSGEGVDLLRDELKRLKHDTEAGTVVAVPAPRKTAGRRVYVAAAILISAAATLVIPLLRSRPEAIKNSSHRGRRRCVPVSARRRKSPSPRGM